MVGEQRLVGLEGGGTVERLVEELGSGRSMHIASEAGHVEVEVQELAVEEAAVGILTMVGWVGREAASTGRSVVGS